MQPRIMMEPTLFFYIALQLVIKDDWENHLFSPSSYPLCTVSSFMNILIASSRSFLCALLLLPFISFACHITIHIPFLLIRTVPSPTFFHSSVLLIALSPFKFPLILFSFYLNIQLSIHTTYPSNSRLGFPECERAQL
jgi:hypothetical protein